MNPKSKISVCAVVALMSAGALVFTGCSNPSGGSGEIAGSGVLPSGSRTVVVKRSDLTPVVSLDSVVASAVGFDITAPISGRVSRSATGDISVTDESGTVHPIKLSPLVTNVVHIVPDGAFASRGLPIARAVYTGFVMSSQIAGADLLRLQSSPDSARAQIGGGGAPFDCDLLDPFSSSSDPSQPNVRRIYCVVPPEQPVMNGLTGITALRFHSTKDALVLPVESVAGSTKLGLVYLLVGEKIIERNVKLGATDGLQIVIADGLNEGDVIEIPSPSILDEKQ